MSRAKTAPVGQLARVRLCVILTERFCSRPVVEAAREVLAGGAQMVQLREKEMGDGELLRLADELRAMTAKAGVLLVINDRPDVALLCGADGVHLGREDLPIERARELLRRGGRGGMLIGASTHSLAQAREAAGAGADYIAVGPVYPTRTKGYERGVGAGLVRRIAAAVDRPLIAIGGITADNVGAVIAAGAQAVAVCSAIVSERDIRGATERVLEAIRAADAGR